MERLEDSPKESTTKRGGVWNNIWPQNDSKYTQITFIIALIFSKTEVQKKTMLRLRPSSSAHFSALLPCTFIASFIYYNQANMQLIDLLHI